MLAVMSILICFLIGFLSPHRHIPSLHTYLTIAAISSIFINLLNTLIIFIAIITIFMLQALFLPNLNLAHDCCSFTAVLCLGCFAFNYFSSQKPAVLQSFNKPICLVFLYESILTSGAVYSEYIKS